MGKIRLLDKKKDGGTRGPQGMAGPQTNDFSLRSEIMSLEKLKEKTWSDSLILVAGISRKEWSKRLSGEIEASRNEEGQSEGQAVLLVGCVPRGRLALGTLGPEVERQVTGGVVMLREDRTRGRIWLPWGTEKDWR